ncbi:MAG: hypothetical protein ACJAVK_002825 [Akkermansiaceae bacterium]
MDPGGVNGNIFVNRADLRPGIGQALGIIDIAGDSSESGTFHSQLNASNVGGSYLGSDQLRVEGSVVLTDQGVLRPDAIDGLTTDDVMVGHRFNIINAAGEITGGWGEIIDGNNTGLGGQTFGSQFFFDTATGDLVAFGLSGDQTTSDFANITENKISILDAVVAGATDDPGNFNSVDAAEGILLNAILTNGAPGDVEARLDALEALSPEGYAGSIDYTLQATRSYSQLVKGATPQVTGSNYEIIAGYSNFGLASASSNDARDYDLSSNGGYLGFKMNTKSDFSFGTFIGFDSGGVDARDLDLDVSGYVLGGYVEYVPRDGINRWSAWGNLTYGDYDFDGKRTGFLSELSVPTFSGSAFQIGTGVNYLAYENEGLRLVPNASLSFLSASTGGFAERGGADALRVDGMDANSTLLEMALRLEYQQPEGKLSYLGALGWQHDFSETDRDVTATVGNSKFNVTAPGLGDDALFIALGAAYRLDDTYQLQLGYRAEFRSDADTLNGFNLGLNMKF